jgi:rfaE bifunctional protein kinase chain/domain
VACDHRTEWSAPLTLPDALQAFRRLSALVIGDVCLDRWCRYQPAFSEPSRETGIPRLAVTSVECTPGAAGTVASNLASLGCGRVSVLGIAGDDGHGHELRRALRLGGIEDDALLIHADLVTFTYTKLINEATGMEDQPRVDFIRGRDLSPGVDAELVRRFNELAPQFDIVVVSDQAEVAVGATVTPALRGAIARVRDRVVWVDSRARAEHFRGVSLKLNQQEADDACARIGHAGDPEALRGHTQAPLLIVTRGAEGAVIYTAQGTTAVRTRSIEKPVDICGAGDSFNAGGALMLALTGDPEAAAQFGNLVASITVMKPGTGAATPEEILAHR